MLQGLEKGLEVTKKALSSVPDSNRDFRLDPKSRTALALPCTSPRATCRCSMKSPILKFDMAPRFKQESRNIADPVNGYELRPHANELRNGYLH